jgi:hypothetical protein
LIGEKHFHNTYVYKAMKASIYLIQHKSISFPVTTVALFLAFCPLAHADMPASSNFQLQEFSFGSGGVTNATSTNFKLNGIAGQTSAGQLSSTNYTAGVGLTFMQTQVSRCARPLPPKL